MGESYSVSRFQSKKLLVLIPEASFVNRMGEYEFCCRLLRFCALLVGDSDNYYEVVSRSKMTKSGSVDCGWYDWHTNA